MTVTEILSKLEAMGNEKMQLHNSKYGAHDNQFGVERGDILTWPMP
jgi:ribosomal protein S17